VLFQEFNSSAIDIQLGFWVRHFKEASQVKSDLIATVGKAFRQQGIVIPYPRQDMHVYEETVQPAVDSSTKSQGIAKQE